MYVHDTSYSEKGKGAEFCMMELKYIPFVVRVVVKCLKNPKPRLCFEDELGISSWSPTELSWSPPADSGLVSLSLFNPISVSCYNV